MKFCQCSKRRNLAARSAEAQKESKPILHQLRSLKIKAIVVPAGGKREILKNRQVLKSRVILKRVATDPLKARPAGHKKIRKGECLFYILLQTISLHQTTRLKDKPKTRV